jgi:hypothetical protein
MPMFTCADESGHCETFEMETAQQAAEFYVHTGSWPDDEKPISRTRAHQITVKDEDEETTQHRVIVHPNQPPCIKDGEGIPSVDEDGHRFRSPLAIVGGIKDNPGVWYAEGGIRTSEVCMRCGCGKTINTWAMDSTGQPYESVSYDTQEYIEALTDYRNGGK